MLIIRLNFISTESRLIVSLEYIGISQYRAIIKKKKKMKMAINSLSAKTSNLLFALNISIFLKLNAQ